MCRPLSHLHCWILDEAYDDYETVWELATVLERRQPERAAGDVHEQLRQGLDALQAQGYVAFWQGTHFAGEQRPYPDHHGRLYRRTSPRLEEHGLVRAPD